MEKPTNMLSISGLVDEKIKPEFQGLVDDNLIEITPDIINRKEITKDKLIELFEEYGATEIKFITEKKTGNSRGFAFVEFNKDDIKLAKLAKDNLDGTELIKGVPIQIVFAEKVKNLEKLDCTV